MTLLIALIASSIHAHLLGYQFIGTGWIVLLWVLHLSVKVSK
jgi:hypothetical protein